MEEERQLIFAHLGISTERLIGDVMEDGLYFPFVDTTMVSLIYPKHGVRLAWLCQFEVPRHHTVCRFNSERV